MSWASYDSPEVSPDRSQNNSTENSEQSNAEVERDLMELKTESSELFHDIEHLSRDNERLSLQQGEIKNKILVQTEKLASRKGIPLVTEDISRVDFQALTQNILDQCEQEKLALIQKNKELEESLDLMRQEFEEMENYWQGKIEEERAFFDKQIQSEETNFGSLELKILEYEQMLRTEQPQEHDLYTIDEDEQMEHQVNYGCHGGFAATSSSIAIRI